MKIKEKKDKKQSSNGIESLLLQAFAHERREQVIKALKEYRTSHNLNGKTMLEVYKAIVPMVQANTSMTKRANKKTQPHVQNGANSESSNTCPICFERIRFNSAKSYLHCKHCFHKECLARWMQDNISCPLCRQKSYINDFPPLADVV